MIRRAVLLMLLAGWPAVADAGFREVVRTVESSTGSRRIYIPFVGMFRTFFQVVEPKGVSDFRIAVFQGKHCRKSTNLDQALLLKAAGPGWQPILRSESRRSGERALIYARPARHNRMRMMIVAHEDNEAAVIELELDMKEFSEFIASAQRGDDRHVSFRW